MRTGNFRPLEAKDSIVICSYQFARNKAADVANTPWDLVVMDEAHRLRNVYKPTNIIANTLKLALACNWLWQLRGIMDRFIGGPGLRRGRRCRDELRLGDALDFWRVTAIDPPRRLELTAEMKMPGRASLSFELKPAGASGSGTQVVMTASFYPQGLLGIAYWYSVVPLHGFVFPGMLNGIARAAEGGASKIS